jgi:hypothetical protein
LAKGEDPDTDRTILGEEIIYLSSGTIGIYLKDEALLPDILQE